MDANKEKDKAMELAEAARETEWELPSFTAELFRGKFRWDLMHPFPAQDAEDRKVGDDYVQELKRVCEESIDPIEIDRTGTYPPESVSALTDIGAFGMKIAKEYGGLGFSVTNYARALAY